VPGLVLLVCTVLLALLLPSSSFAGAKLAVVLLCQILFVSSVDRILCCVAHLHRIKPCASFFLSLNCCLWREDDVSCIGYFCWTRHSSSRLKIPELQRNYCHKRIWKCRSTNGTNAFLETSCKETSCSTCQCRCRTL
jgi:hypothetical protein